MDPFGSHSYFCQMVTCFGVYTRVLSSISFIAMALAISSFGFTANAIGLSNIKIKMGQPFSEPRSNIVWFKIVTMILLTFVGLIMLIFEFLLLISPEKFGFVKFAPSRALSYLIIGLTVIGTAADLGIAAGAFSLLAFGLTLLTWIVFKLRCQVVSEVDNSFGTEAEAPHAKGKGKKAGKQAKNEKNTEPNKK